MLQLNLLLLVMACGLAVFATLLHVLLVGAGGIGVFVVRNISYAGALALVVAFILPSDGGGLVAAVLLVIIAALLLWTGVIWWLWRRDEARKARESALEVF